MPRRERLQDDIAAVAVLIAYILVMLVILWLPTGFGLR